MRKRVLIVGGGTAGWLAAGYLAKRLSADLPGGVAITLVESPEIGILGVGEGTFPTIRRTLKTIGISEVDLIRKCGASFKQGAKFAHWRFTPGQPGPDHYTHPFQLAEAENGLDLLPYWLLGHGGEANWDEVCSPQKKAADAHRAPKLPSHPDYVAPLNYAFHFDAVALATLLRDKAVANGVTHLTDRVTEVHVDEGGAIAGVDTQASGRLEADLYIDCTGFRAELIGKALGQPYRSCRDVLFCDTALAIQVPYRHERDPIVSYTMATAQEAGWMWDIGLDLRRGIGHVFSSAHADDARAEELLRAYVGDVGAKQDVRKIRFEAGYRETNWHKNCVAIGLSSGFFEPLEATGIVFSEVAAGMVANLFPWGGDYETSARQFNANMLQRYEPRVISSSCITAFRNAAIPTSGRIMSPPPQSPTACTTCSIAGAFARRQRSTSTPMSTSLPRRAGNMSFTEWVGRLTFPPELAPIATPTMRAGRSPRCSGRRRSRSPICPATAN